MQEEVGFASMASVGRTVLISAFAAIIIASNMVMIVAYAIEKRLQTYNNSFILNLIISDLMVGLSLITTLVTKCYVQTPVCRIFLCIGKGLVGVSVITIVVICVDRHQATYHPIKHFLGRSKTRACILNAIPWVVAFTFWLLVALFGPRFDASAPARMASQQISVFLNLLPLVVIAVLYTRILYKIKNSLGAQRLNDKFDTKPNNSGSGIDPETESPENSGSVLQSHGESEMAKDDRDIDRPEKEGKAIRKKKNRESDASARKATRFVSFIIISLLISWMSHTALFVVIAVGLSKVPVAVGALIWTLSYINSVLNPISYAAAQPLFRRTVAGMICNPKHYC
ncbi:muscarinic acetylcholine receptor M3-like [Lytechinus variegatus]|uniref:muscarinic acetylcholine receptor M3-like n=1 Tax=Lytechinus variegatus TaxID=7654 RepID=UPI001BB266BC|nr:muscarinic acetylcholine receptor M3-like [Lytechinus variegatus]